jgi:hypothetical protein
MMGWSLSLMELGRLEEQVAPPPDRVTNSSPVLHESINPAGGQTQATLSSKRDRDGYAFLSGEPRCCGTGSGNWARFCPSFGRQVPPTAAWSWPRIRSPLVAIFTVGRGFSPCQYFAVTHRQRARWGW